MITDEQARWIGLFFLFSLMDEKTALHAAHKTVAYLKATASGRGASQTISRVAIVKALRKQFEIHRKQIPRNRNVVVPVPEAAWALADHADIAPWAKFQKDAADSELIAVTLSKILSFSDQEIAEGLGISLGTARYRVGKGIRQLGVFFGKTGKVRA